MVEKKLGKSVRSISMQVGESLCEREIVKDQQNIFKDEFKIPSSSSRHPAPLPQSFNKVCDKTLLPKLKLDVSILRENIRLFWMLEDPNQKYETPECYEIF